MRKLYVTKNLGDRGYQIESEDGRYVNRISREALAEIVKKGAINGIEVMIVNNMEDEDIELYDVVVEDYEDVYDVVATKIVVADDSNDVEFKILDEYSKSYKRETTANNYAKKVIKELEYLA